MALWAVNELEGRKRIVRTGESRRHTPLAHVWVGRSIHADGEHDGMKPSGFTVSSPTVYVFKCMTQSAVR